MLDQGGAAWFVLQEYLRFGIMRSEKDYLDSGFWIWIWILALR